MIVVHHEKVIEVAAHFFCRRHCGINIKFLSLREGREYTGEHVCLYLCRDIELRLDTSLLGRDRGIFLDVMPDVAVHFREGIGECFKLIACMYIDSRQVILFKRVCHLSGCIIQPVYRSHDLLAKRKVEDYSCKHRCDKYREAKGTDESKEAPLDVIGGKIKTDKRHRLSRTVKDRIKAAGDMAVGRISVETYLLDGVLSEGFFTGFLAAVHVGLALPEPRIRIVIRLPYIDEVVFVRHEDIEELHCSLIPGHSQIAEHLVIIFIGLKSLNIALYAVSVYIVRR